MLFSFKADTLFIQSKDLTVFHYDLAVDDRISYIMSVCSIYNGIYQILAWSDMRLVNISQDQVSFLAFFNGSKDITVSKSICTALGGHF